MTLPVYKTPEELRAAIKDFIDNPPMRKITAKGQEVMVENFTSQSIALHLGFSSRQSLYDQEKRGPEWKEVVDYARSETKSYYELQGLHGNSATANYMLGTLGESVTNKVELTGKDGGAMENKWQVEFINAETKDQ